MKPNHLSSTNGCGTNNTPAAGAFSLVELLALLTVLGLLALTLVPVRGQTRVNGATLVCRNNLRQLTSAWHSWSEQNNQMLLTCLNPPEPGAPSDSGVANNNQRLRPNWVTGNLDYSGGNASNWDPQRDLVQSPMWNLAGKSAALFRCPADQSSVNSGGVTRLRVRSYSMSQVFSRGEWLDGPNTAMGGGSWRTYWRMPQIARPASTFVFIGEHPDSINDGAFANQCTGATPLDPPNTARIIDFPTARHSGAANLSFSDGHVETHRWKGSRIRNTPIKNDNSLALNVAAGDSWMDVQWLTENTTVHK